MTQTLPRGTIGVLPRPTTLADESYLNFVQSCRKVLIREMFPAVARVGEARYAAWKECHAPQEDELEDIKRVFREVPLVRTFQRFVRTQQEMMWRRTRESFVRVGEEHLRELDTAQQQGCARLELTPGLEIPDWARQDIHLQPGGYTDDPIGGLVFHYGTGVFYEGANDQDELHHELAEQISLPEDGRIGRILDVGCSIGQATLALKRRFPQADVTGLDIGLPVLRYGQKRANDAGLEVAFRHALAQESGFPDSHFDCILSYILFHETPSESFPAILAELYRVLRPGGVLSIFEFPNSYGVTLPPATRFLIDYDSRNNCEPFSVDFVYSDFQGMLREAGFAVEEGPKLSNPFLQSIVARKPTTTA